MKNKKEAIKQLEMEAKKITEKENVTWPKNVMLAGKMAAIIAQINAIRSRNHLNQS